jgi:hypothetical protein
MLALSCAVACGESSAPTNPEGPDTPENEAEVNSGKVSLRIPVVDEKGKLLSRYNAKLAAARLPTYPDTIEIHGRADGSMVPRGDEEWERVMGFSDKVYEKLHLDVQQEVYGEPYEFKTDDPATSLCYRGSGKLVASLVADLASRVFSDQLNIHGWRYRQMKVLHEDAEEGADADFPAIWHNWRGGGAAVLMITASSDDGSETNVNLIPQCL